MAQVLQGEAPVEVVAVVVPLCRVGAPVGVEAPAEVGAPVEVEALLLCCTSRI